MKHHSKIEDELIKNSGLKNSLGELSLVILALREYYKYFGIKLFFHRKRSLKTEISIRAIVTGYFMDRVKLK